MIQYFGFIATSLDGKIATRDGGIDWLTNPKYTIENEDFGYSKFFSSVDCLVMGKNTFLKILEFPTFPYEKKKIWVLSRSKIEIPPHLQEYVTQHMGTISDLNDLLAKDGKTKRVYVDGGKVISSFLKLKLLNDIMITLIPIVLGDGIPLWELELTKFVELKTVSSQLFANGFLQVHYSLNDEII